MNPRYRVLDTAGNPVGPTYETEKAAHRKAWQLCGSVIPYHSQCAVVRRHLVTYSTLNMVTGVSTRSEREPEMVTEPCGAPLFTEAEHRSGKCRSCASGFTHPENYPVEPVEPGELAKTILAKAQAPVVP